MHKDAERREHRQSEDRWADRIPSFSGSRVTFSDDKGQELDSFPAGTKHFPTSDRSPEEIAANYQKEANSKRQKDNDILSRNRNWKDGHGFYEHIDNPVVRLRHNERTDANGNKTFFLEEIQAPKEDEPMPDWLRKRSYDVGLKRALVKAVDSGSDQMGWTTGSQQSERYGLDNKVRVRSTGRLRWRRQS